MATFALIDPAQPIRNGDITVGAMGTIQHYHGHEQDITGTALAAAGQMSRVDSAYKIAGSTSWERPGGPTTP